MGANVTMTVDVPNVLPPEPQAPKVVAMVTEYVPTVLTGHNAIDLGKVNVLGSLASMVVVGPGPDKVCGPVTVQFVHVAGGINGSTPGMLIKPRNV